jgi:hypothetical protein
LNKASTCWMRWVCIAMVIRWLVGFKHFFYSDLALEYTLLQHPRSGYLMLSLRLATMLHAQIQRLCFGYSKPIPK